MTLDHVSPRSFSRTVELRTCFLLVRHHGAKPFLHRWEDDRWRAWSWEETAQRVASLARALRELGIRAGDRVLLAAENRVEWHVSALAILAARAINVPLSMSGTADEWAEIIRNAEPRGLIASPTGANKFRSSVRAGGWAGAHIEMTTTPSPGVLAWDAATARVAATSNFVTRTLVALALCMFSLPTIAARESPAEERALFSLAFATLFFGIAWAFVRGNHFEHALLGMKRRDWGNQLRGALPCTLTLMAAIFAGKVLLGGYNGFDAGVFEPMRAPIRYGFPGIVGWTTLAIVFGLAGVAVEFTRCTLQGSLAFLFGSARHLATWGANIAANTLCAATQVHLGVVSTLLIFSCGLFWGWLFARQRSFFAVAFSHAVVGPRAGFILGLPE